MQAVFWRILNWTGILHPMAGVKLIADNEGQRREQALTGKNGLR
jgi:hypothetical protein